VVYVVTEHDSVYAFDADSTNILWQSSMLRPGEQTDTNFPWCSITPELGITATPVIDRQAGPNGTNFVEAVSVASTGDTFQRLHALDLSTGQDRVPPVDIYGEYPGQGESGDGTTLFFVPGNYYERACMLLLNGIVYTAWSAHCDGHPATSWIFGFDENTLAQVNIINLTPNGGLGSIWNSGAGPAADSDGNIYVTLGNGTFDDTLDGNGFPLLGDYGGALVKLATTNGALTVVDYFAMYNVQKENTDDIDFGSGAALVPPDLIDSNGVPRQLVVASAKDKSIYIADRSNMGKFSPDNNNALFQQIPDALGRGAWSMPAFFNNTLYFGPVRSPVLAFAFQSNQLSGPISQSPTSLVYPGGTPSVSANGTANGIVWVVEDLGLLSIGTEASKSPALHAYAATNLANEIYHNYQSGERDRIGFGNTFVLPMIASGRVYVGTAAGVGVFGLLDLTALSPLQQWRNTWFGNPSDVGAGANSANPAGDGVANLVKYALDLNPSLTVTNSPVAPGIMQDAGQSYFSLIINRLTNHADIIYRAEVSNDLKTWNSGPGYTTTVTNTDTQLVIRENSPITNHPRRFFRLRFLPAS
jgi:hypothetical protein